MTRRIYVTDTNVLVLNPDILLEFGHCQIVVPMAVITELDRFKRLPDHNDPRAKAARQVTRILDSLGQKGDISVGTRTPAGALVSISRRHLEISDLASRFDNMILGTAIHLKRNNHLEVIMLTNDGNMRAAARAYGIKAEACPASKKIPSDGRGKTVRVVSAPEKADRRPMANAAESQTRSWPYLVILIIVIIILVAFLNTK